MKQSGHHQLKYLKGLKYAKCKNKHAKCKKRKMQQKMRTKKYATCKKRKTKNPGQGLSQI